MKKSPEKNVQKAPVFALTMGDPAGIGPEIAIKALLSRRLCHVRTVIIGDLDVLLVTARKNRMDAAFNAVSDIRTFYPGVLNVLDMNKVPLNRFKPGRVSALCGRAAYAYILKGIDLAKQGVAAGVITNPINKEAFNMAGINFPGHTEIFAHETRVKDFTMLFYLDGVGVAHVTTHCSLRQSIRLISEKRVLSHIRLLNLAMKQLGVKSPRIAVGGLNPHAGENGLFGDEEIEHIVPAIKKARSLGVNASGPFPPDTVFMRAFRGEFDGVVSMLHDHGFVALKSRDFEHGVNITIGLPIIRTSVGHGTAFDKVGKGIASPESLITAIKAAERLYRNRKMGLGQDL
ncbi:MAG: 4-hydroxythreonine-4-phosphate dehydrogenase PdxA [Chitinispirillaceae bacterium]|nr:4-hydroxythreonine-4-phosphate dehydrogenase PdxA [Chitinispirillaceae bacterium]